MNDNWETFTINMGTPEGEEPGIYRANEKDRGDLTEQFETELTRLVLKYNSYGKRLGLTITAENSAGEDISEFR